mmetsp:Transcript_9728/g.31838  ORF Transcript_9728/g.31838 Transcript_9728/m.31838 type:complete len:365 (-) Transcript_9728:1378-2472(-)
MSSFSRARNLWKSRSRSSRSASKFRHLGGARVPTRGFGSPGSTEGCGTGFRVTGTPPSLLMRSAGAGAGALRSGCCGTCCAAGRLATPLASRSRAADMSLLTALNTALTSLSSTSGNSRWSRAASSRVGRLTCTSCAGASCVSCAILAASSKSLSHATRMVCRSLSAISGKNSRRRCTPSAPEPAAPTFAGPAVADKDDDDDDELAWNAAAVGIAASSCGRWSSSCKSSVASFTSLFATVSMCMMCSVSASRNFCMSFASAMSSTSNSGSGGGAGADASGGRDSYSGADWSKLSSTLSERKLMTDSRLCFWNTTMSRITSRSSMMCPNMLMRKSSSSGSTTGSGSGSDDEGGSLCGLTKSGMSS